MDLYSAKLFLQAVTGVYVIMVYGIMDHLWYITFTES